MTTRSILLRKILRGWDQSTEAQHYLGWLIDADPRLDTGDVLREAVLEILEDEETPRDELEGRLDEFCSTLEPEVAAQVKSLTAELERHVTSMNASLRDRTAKIRELRHRLGLGRLETLALLADAQHAAADQSDNMSTSEIVAAVNKFAKLAEGASYEECVRLAHEHLPPGLDLNRIVNALMEDSTGL